MRTFIILLFVVQTIATVNTPLTSILKREQQFSCEHAMQEIKILTSRMQQCALGMIIEPPQQLCEQLEAELTRLNTMYSQRCIS
jgi:hypothetical protein